MGKRKKTHEEYVNEVLIINPNIEVIGEYVNANTKITHHCLKHNVYWDIKPANIVNNGEGCELCRREKIRNSHSKTHDKYIKEVENINPYIIVEEKYAGAKTPILHKCTIHNVEWKVAPSNILNGQGCQKCKSEKIHEKQIKSDKQYNEELKRKNPNIISIEKYNGANVSILHKCLIDNYEWYAQPSNTLNGYGCPKCSKRFRRTHDDYVREAFIINPNIQVIGKFNGLQIPILHRCKLHKIDWMAKPDNILRGHGCIECGKEKIRDKNCKTHEEYVDELNNINPDIIVLGMYINANTPILHKCLIDGHEWYAQPANILSGKGCPQCNESNGERQVRLWLEKHHIKYERQKTFHDCRDNRSLPFDFYLPDYNTAIEYDGKQHYEPIAYFGGQETYEHTIIHDNIKNEYCKNNGISLLRIPYFKNVEEELNNFLFI